MNLQSVNDAQKEAICHKDGPMMVLAGPGSGKTFVITHRIQYLLQQDVLPEQILVITFTKASALEMQERFQKLVGDIYAPVNFGTFHAVYFHILKKEFQYDASSILTEKEKCRYMKEIMNEVISGKDVACSPQQILSCISKCKNDDTSSLEYQIPDMEPEQFQKLYCKYEEVKRREHKLDFEDMVLQCRDLFMQRPDILEKWRKIYSYILIDEFQDINRMQYEVIKMLTAPFNNLFVVGDDDQSIYGFRGSKPEIMLHFPEQFAGCKRVFLNINYRCNPWVVKTASEFITCNKMRFEKHSLPHKINGEPVMLCVYESKDKQAEDIVFRLQKLKQTIEYRNMAILIRTNTGAGLLTQQLSMAGIPYRFKEHPVSVFTKDYALDMISFLKFVFLLPKRSDLLRFLNKPARYLKRDLFREPIVDLEQAIHQNGRNYPVCNALKTLKRQIEVAGKMDLYAASRYFLKGMGYEIYLKRLCKEGKLHKEEVDNDLELIRKSLEGRKSIELWLEQMEEYETNLMDSAKDSKEDAVNIVTMHSSKGLEYDVVFLPDLNEGNMPQGKAVSVEEMEEERRVLYVAMTRAKEKLYLSYVEGNKENRLLKSRFLKQMKYLEVYSSSSSSISSSNS